MRVVIAPDSFKGTARASDVARALGAGWASVRGDDDVRVLPMADGGEGTLDAFELAVPGARRMPVVVAGPDDRRVEASWLLLPAGDDAPHGTGVVELACTSGLALLDPLRPLRAHTLGFGQAIAAALDHGVSRLLLAIGGSASSDGGAGALTALGARFLDARGATVPLGNLGLHGLASADLSGLRALPPGGARVLSDVTNPMLGRQGAAAVFGPQKGADAAAVREIEANLARLAAMLEVDPATPGAGAAGATGFGLLAWGAQIAPGSAAVAEALGVPAALRDADVVITGEGSFDAQSSSGKVPGHIAGLAAAHGVRAMLVAGSIRAEPRGFSDALALTELAGGGEAAQERPLAWLHIAAARLATTAGTRG